jgi:hypothetical protein
MSEPDFRRYYHLETYLFDEVSSRFAERSKLSVFDFFCIVIWKANRSKSKVARRLLAAGHADLDAAVEALLSQVAAAPSPKERLRALVEDRKFRLPMASAILTVLYPKDFTVYDVRVCGMLNEFREVQDKTKFEAQWEGYCSYRDAVDAAAPPALSLRDKDRWLWGKSFSEQLQRDVANGFALTEESPETGAIRDEG